MKPKTMILMGLAITCGLGASYMTSQLLADRQPHEEAKVVLMVAKRPLSIGEPIRKPDEMFEKKEFVAGQEPKDAVPEKDFDALKGKIMKVSLRKGDHITPNDVSGDGGLQIPEGHYAMGFPVNMVTSASGFASLPLSRVDIILTIRRGDDKASRAKVLLRNVLVLAADTDVGREKGIAAPAQVVTFALKPEEALKVRLAAEMGLLSLALRKQNDRTVMDTPDVNGESIMSDSKKDEETGILAADSPKKYTPVAPTLFPKEAPSAPPALYAKDSKQPAEKPAPKVDVVEAPKVLTHTLTVWNGTRSDQYQTQMSEDGRIVGSGSDAGPTPPRKKTPLLPTPDKTGEF